MRKGQSNKEVLINKNCDIILFCEKLNRHGKNSYECKVLSKLCDIVQKIYNSKTKAFQ